MCDLKDSCPGVSMINMPGILNFSLSNCIKMKGKNRFRMTAYTPVRVYVRTSVCVCTCSHIFDHLGLLLDGLPGDVGCSDLLRDASSFTVLDVGVSQLHEQIQQNC